MHRTYAEIGIGNGSIVSTEIETEHGEVRVPRFVAPRHVDDVYLRFWIGRRVLILSTKNGIKVTRKDSRNFKLLFGLGGQE